MTLTNRLLAFYLTAIAIVLVGSSIAIYLLADAYLNRRLSERLKATENVLVAAMETGPLGFEWEPSERILPASGLREERIYWIVVNQDGEVVGRSDLALDRSFLSGFSMEEGRPEVVQTVVWNGDQLSGRIRRLGASPSEKDEAPIAGRREANERWHASLSIAVATPKAPVDAALRKLSIALGGVSAAIWFVALVVGRWFCRRALAPIAQMAATARAIKTDELADRFAKRGVQDELSDLSDSFNDLLVRLHVSLKRQQRFTSEASHQLRTPLTVILGQIEVALRRNRAIDEYRKVLETIHPQAESLHRMTESLLFLARADADATLPHQETVDLAKWISQEFQFNRYPGREPDVHLSIEGAGPFFIRANSELLAVLVGNLLDNAIKYSQKGTAVSVRLTRDGDKVLLIVEDQGCGISEQDLPLIFDAFFRSSAARDRGIAGFGLGLSIAQRIADAFEANLTIKSGIERGTQVLLSFSSSN